MAPLSYAEKMIVNMYKHVTKYFDGVVRQGLVAIVTAWPLQPQGQNVIEVIQFLPIFDWIFVDGNKRNSMSKNFVKPKLKLEEF